LAGNRGQIEARGARAAAVTMGGPEEIVAFCGSRAPGVLCLSDPERSAYRSYGLGMLGAAEVLSPSVMVAGVKAALEGHAQGAPVGEPRQMPGLFVVGRDGRIALAHYSRTVADQPELAAILAALGG
jgi:peroxiredoxin